jgi:hypothetical protein
VPGAWVQQQLACLGKQGFDVIWACQEDDQVVKLIHEIRLP